MMGLNAIRKMSGERVSPWKTPFRIGNDGDDQFFVETYADKLE